MVFDGCELPELEDIIKYGTGEEGVLAMELLELHNFILNSLRIKNKQILDIEYVQFGSLLEFAYREALLQFLVHHYAKLIELYVFCFEYLIVSLEVLLKLL